MSTQRDGGLRNACRRPLLLALAGLLLVAMVASAAVGAPARKVRQRNVAPEAPTVAVRDEGSYFLVRYTTDGKELQRFTGFGRVTDLARYDERTILVAEQDRGAITAFDLEAGRIVWDIRVRQPRCIESLGDDRFLACLEGPATVVEIDRAAKIFWQLAEPLVDASGAARLADGNTAIVEGRSGHHAVHIVDRDGKFLWSGTENLAQPLGVVVLPSGELLTSGFDSGLMVFFRPYKGLSRSIGFCCHAQRPAVGPGGMIAAASPERQVVQAWTAEGAPAWAFSTFYPPYEVELLEDGTVLVAVYRIPDRTCFDAARQAEVDAAPTPVYLRSLAAGTGGGLLLGLLLQWPVVRRRIVSARRRWGEIGSVADAAPPTATPLRRLEIAFYVAGATALVLYAAQVHDEHLRRLLARAWPYAGFVSGAGVLLALLQQRLPRRERWTERMRDLVPSPAPTWRAALGWVFGLGLVAVAFEGVYRRRGAWVPAVWSAGLVLLAAGSLQEAEPRSGAGRGGRGRALLALAGGAVLVAALLFVRVYRLEEVPPNLHHDMAQWTLQALRLLDGNVPTLFTNGWAQIPMVGYLWSALVTGLGDRSLAAARLPSAVGGLLAILAVFVLVRRLYGFLPALFATLLLGSDHVFVHFSRIQSYMDPVPFHVLAVLGLFAGFETGRYGWFALAGLAGGFSTLSYHAGRITPLAMALLVAVVVVRYPRTLVRRGLGLLLAVLSIVAVVGVQGIIYAAGLADAYGRVDQFAWVTPNGIDFALLQQVVANASARVFGSLWYYHDASTQYGGLVYFFPPVAALLGAAIAAAFLRPWDIRGLFLVLWGALVLFVGGVLTRDPPFWPRLVMALVPATIAAGVAAAQLCRAAAVAAGRIGAVVALGAALALFFFNGREQLELYRAYVEGRDHRSGRPGRSTQWVQSLMGRDAQRWNDGAMIYVVAPNPIVHSCTHPTMEYYVYGLDSQDARDIREYLPFDRTRTTVAYFLPEVGGSIAAVRRAHPDAKVRHFYDNLEQHVFTRVVVEKR